MTEFGAALPPRKCTFAEKITENPLTIFLASCIMSKLRNGSIAQPGEHLPYKQGVTGSSPVVPTSFSIAYASVAQLVEQGTENPRVIGSIPIGGTTSKILSFIGKSCKQDFCDEYQIFSFSPQNLAPQAFAGAPKFARIAREGAGINAPDMRP